MATKKRDCKHCGKSHHLTEKWFYIYEGRAPICKIQETARQKDRVKKRSKK